VRCGGKSDGEVGKGRAHHEAGNGGGGVSKSNDFSSDSQQLRGLMARGCEGRRACSLPEEKWHREKRG
jgi:hypothetical protein